MDNIDFSELNLSYFFELYESYKKDKSSFNKNRHVEEIKKYKTTLISILYNDIFSNKNTEKYSLNFKSLNKNDKLTICTLPFITPITDKGQQFGLTFKSNHITLDFTKIDDDEMMEFVLKLYTQPQIIYKYCVETIILFNKKFKDYIKKRNTEPELCNKPKLVYEYSNN